MDLGSARDVGTEKTDRSTALRQLPYAGAESYVMDLLDTGRISASRAAEVLGVSVYRAHELAEKHRTQAGADLGDHGRAREAARGLP